MKRRTASVLIGILAVVCIGILLSAIFPLTTSNSHAVNPPSDRFTVDDTDAYTASGSIVVEGEVKLAFEGVVTKDGAWYQRVVEQDVVTESYQFSENGTVYHRRTIEGRDKATQQREQIVQDEDRVLVRENQDGDRVTFVVEENGTGVTEPVSGTASVFVNSLYATGYEIDGVDSTGDTIYEPRPGWYDDREPYRITNTSGEVYADAETHVVDSVNVSWERTAPAGSYAEYLLVRLLSDEPTAYRITLEVEPGSSELERPPWASEAS
jgi:hypothetical protein